MGRYKKQIYWLLGILLVVSAVYIFSGGSGIEGLGNIVDKDVVVIDDFRMAKIIDENSNYYVIEADEARMNQKSKTAVLTQFTLEYKKDDGVLKLSADEGFIAENDTMDAKGNVHGDWNGQTFQTSPEGSFRCNLKTEVCQIDGKLVVTGDEVNIFSDKAVIYQKQNEVEFIDNVKVVYKN